MRLAELLSAVPLFARLDAAAAGELGAAATLLHLAAGEPVFDVGDETSSLFALVPPARRRPGPPAAVQLELPGTGGAPAVRIDRLGEGDVFGDTELLLSGIAARPRRRVFRARALGAVDLIEIPLAGIVALAARDEAFRRVLLREGAVRLYEALSRQAMLRSSDINVALADYLVERADADGRFFGNSAEFRYRITQETIAEDLGVSRRTVTERFRQWSLSGLLRTTPFALLDVERIRLIAEARRQPPRALVERVAREVDRRLAAGDLAAARNIALDHLVRLPGAPDLVYRAALAAARLSAPGEAAAILTAGGLSLDDGFPALLQRLRVGLARPERLAVADRDPDDDDEDAARADGARLPVLVEDIAGLWARLAKDEAFVEAGAERLKLLASRSARLYAEAFERTRRPFTGVNAASMALVTGDAAAARKLAAGVLARIPEGATDYWSRASRAEALLVAGETGAGTAALAAAASCDDATDGARASTRLQLRRLAPALGLTAPDLLAALPVRRPAVVTGTLLRAGVLGPEAREAVENRIRAEALRLFAEHNVGAVYGALGCGADILFAEAAAEADLPFHVVLPLPVDEFVAASVAIGDADWTPRFEAALAGAASLTLLNPGGVLRRDLDAAFHHGFRNAAGRAIAHAHRLETEPLLVAALRGEAKASFAGSATAAAGWHRAARDMAVIAVPEVPSPAGARSEIAANGFAAVLFVFPVEDSATEAVAARIEGVAGRPPLRRALKDGRSGLAIALGAVELDLADRISAALLDLGSAVRIICDFGAVLDGKGTLVPDQVARLEAASDLVGFPENALLATDAFAMEALFLALPRRFVEIGRAIVGESSRSSATRAAAASGVFLAARG
jgi:CRP-like cAMP-binding protein